MTIWFQLFAKTGALGGGTTLAVMSRASLGHTGRALVASPATKLIYGLVLAAAVARIGAALEPRFAIALLDAAGIAWAMAST